MAGDRVMKSIDLILPYPPSLNSYYRTYRGKMLISKKGRAYRREIAAIIAVRRLGTFHAKTRLSVQVGMIAPDRRRRDVDNIFKSVGDSLQHAGVFADDSQIDDLRIVRGKVDEHGVGWLDVVIAEVT